MAILNLLVFQELLENFGSTTCQNCCRGAAIVSTICQRLKVWLGDFTISLRLCLVMLEWVWWAFGEVGVSLRGRPFRCRPTFRGRRNIWWRGNHAFEVGGTFGDVGVSLFLAAFGDADIGSTRKGILSFHVLSFSAAASSPPCAALWPAVLIAVVWWKAGVNYIYLLTYQSDLGIFWHVPTRFVIPTKFAFLPGLRTYNHPLRIMLPIVFACTPDDLTHPRYQGFAQTPLRHLETELGPLCSSMMSLVGLCR